MAIVTYENVVEAAESLVTEGQKASVRNVIKRLGGGSPNTVLKLLGEYKAGRPVIRSSDIELDPSIIAAMIKQMRTVAETATADAEERLLSLSDDLQTLAEANQSLEQRVEQLMSELTVATMHIEQLTSQQHDQQLKFAGDLDALKARNSELATDLEKERDHANGAQQELGRAQAKAEAVPALEALIAKLQEELKTEGAARATAEQRAAVAEAQAKLVTEQATKTAADTTKQLDAAKVAAEKADQAHKDALAQLRKDLDDTRQQVRDSAAELKATRAQIDTLHSQLTEKTAHAQEK